MSRQTNIKEVIETLCQLLYHHGHSKINAEIFRIAKFDRDEARPHLFKLIIEIIEIEIPSLKSFSYNEYLILLKYLFNLDYPNLNGLLCNRVDELSSQELLLAFGYVIYQQNYIEKLYETIDMMLAGTPISRKRDAPNETEISSDLNHVIVLKRKIDLAFRDLHAQVRYLFKLFSKISDEHKTKVLKEIQAKYCRLVDLVTFGNYKMQNDLLVCLNKQILLYKLHIKWLKCEPIFWKWMISVFNETNGHNNISLSHSVKLKYCFLFSNSKTRSQIESKNFQGETNLYKDVFIELQPYLQRLLMENVDKLNNHNGGNNNANNNLNNNVEREIKKLENEIKLMHEENSRRLADVFDKNFPCYVQLPFPRK